MITDFTNIEYLKSGNERQKKAYQELKKLKIFEKLKTYDPILTGTIPIEIDLPESDLDIICECKDHLEFSKHLTELFANKKDFKLKSNCYYNMESTIAKFKSRDFKIEIFGQNVPTRKQHAYRHMLIEYDILNQKGSHFKTNIKKLKSEGLNTEAAFAKLLSISGNPYEALLNIKITGESI
ncbi:DUF4269 domain-containing protein [Flavivirga eckloniae]|uniref:DUF4269 domain-containing protein n=1 Tax=Flavivirga eckloniae TaxID=1803846 RepID=A0A2K9PXV1_9FLAO|nr:DUF4269 domain-containing protein [Flavivirga eckloniae]AUP81367.1 DUF4269 domain-containing protein [Flavivirga eckloniae]